MLAIAGRDVITGKRRRWRRGLFPVHASEGWRGEPPALLRHGLHRVAQRSIVRTGAGVAHCRTVDPQSLARPTLAHPMHLTSMSHRFPLRVGRHHFLRRHPSGSRCPASARQAVSSARRSRPPKPSGDGRDSFESAFHDRRVREGRCIGCLIGKGPLEQERGDGPGSCSSSTTPARQAIDRNSSPSERCRLFVDHEDSDESEGCHFPRDNRRLT